MELSVEKSQQLATHIEMMKPIIQLIDVEYAKEIEQAMRSQAHRQETLSILKPSHDPVKNELLAKQAQALGSLLHYIGQLKECDELKSKIAQNKLVRSEIDGLFI